MSSEANTKYALVSIIIPTYNSGKTLRRALESIDRQTFRDFEVIIGDGGSKDDTLKIADEFLHHRFTGKLFSGPDKGVYDAMNKGILESDGEWIYFLGSDDALYDNTVLETIFGKNLEGVDVVYGDVFNQYLNRRYDGQFDNHKLCAEGICHQSIFYRRGIFERFGMYDHEMKVYAHIYHDKILFTDQNVKWMYIDKVIADYDGSGMSRYSFDVKYWENAEQLLNKCFGGILPKSEIYNALLPYTQWHHSLDTLKVAGKILIYSGSTEGLKHWFNHPYQFARLGVKKIFGKKK